MSLGVMEIVILAIVAHFAIFAAARGVSTAKRREPLRTLPPPEAIYFVIGCSTAVHAWFAFTATGSSFQTLLLLLLMASVGVVYRIAGRTPRAVATARPSEAAGRVSWLRTAAVVMVPICLLAFVLAYVRTETVVVTRQAAQDRNAALLEARIAALLADVQAQEKLLHEKPPSDADFRNRVEQHARQVQALEALRGQRDALRAPPPPTPQDAFGARMTWLGFLLLLVVGGGVAALVRRQVVERQRSDEGHPTHPRDSSSLGDGADVPRFAPPRFAAVAGSSAVALLSTVVMARLALIVRAVAPAPEQWAWLAVTAAAGSVAVLLVESALGRSPDVGGHPARRRFLHAVGGCVVGLISWSIYRHLRVDLPFEYGEWGVGIDQWRECYDDSLSPLLPAFVGYFGLTSFLTAWWHNLPRGRRHRGTFDFSDAVIAVLWAGAVQCVFPFPQPWGLLAQATIVLTVQFAAPRLETSAQGAPLERRGAA